MDMKEILDRCAHISYNGSPMISYSHKCMICGKEIGDEELERVIRLSKLYANNGAREFEEKCMRSLFKIQEDVDEIKTMLHRSEHGNFIGEKI